MQPLAQSGSKHSRVTSYESCYGLSRLLGPRLRAESEKTWWQAHLLAGIPSLVLRYLNRRKSGGNRKRGISTYSFGCPTG